MKRYHLAAAIVLGLALAGCGITPPSTPSVSGSAVTASPVGPATSTAPSPSPSATPSASEPTPSLSPLVLGGTMLGTFGVGSPEKAVTGELTARLGEATDSDQGPLCELDTSSHYARTLLYGSMWVQFAAADSKQTSPRTLYSWGANVEKKLPNGVVMQDDVPLTLSWKQLKAKYPAAKSVQTGAEGTQALRLPNKLLFTGDTVPLQVQGGEFSVCE